MYTPFNNQQQLIVGVQDIILDTVQRGVSSYTNPDTEWDAIRQIDSAATQSEEELRTLYSQCILYDTAHLPVKEEAVTRRLNRWAGGKSRSKSRVAKHLQLDCPGRTARVLCRIGSVRPDVFHAILSGRYYTSISLLDRRGIDGLDLSFEEVLDIIEIVARYHMAASVLCAGDNCLRRVFEPSGMDVLDHWKAGRATTVGSVAGVLAYNADWILDVLRLYAESKERDLTTEEAKLVDVPGLEVHGRLQEEFWRKKFGDAFPAFLEEITRQALRKTHLIRTASRKVLADRSFSQKYVASICKTPAMPMLWLSCSGAIAWISAREGEVSPLRQALDGLAHGKEPITPPLRDVDHFRARQLFFTASNLVARHPMAKAVRAASAELRKEGCDLGDPALVEDALLDTFDRMLGAELTKSHDKEPLSTKVSEEADKLLDLAMTSPTKYAAVLKEAFGSMALKMKL